LTVAGLPGIQAELVPALDMFTKTALENPDVEICGALIYRHLQADLSYDGQEPTWLFEIDFVQLENVHLTPAEGFQIKTDELVKVLQGELDHLHLLAASVSDESIFAAGFSPLVGIVHSHPAGTTDPSHADYLLLEAASTWRRATAPGAILSGDPKEAKFYEADYIFALHKDEGSNAGTLVHFKRGSKRAEWKGNF